MKKMHELILYNEITPNAYLREMLEIYPYDIEASQVYALLEKNPIPSASLLQFIDFMRHVHKYQIITKSIKEMNLEMLFETICKVSQRNQMVLHTHQFHFNATLYTATYPLQNPYAHLPLEQIEFIDHIHVQLPASMTMQNSKSNLAITMSDTFLYRDISLQADAFFALSIQIADQHGILFLPRHHIGLLCACASLYQITKPKQHNDFFLIYGLNDRKSIRQYYYDATNQLYIGLVSGPENFDHFSGVKDMITTLYSAICLKKNDYPVHASMMTLHVHHHSIGLLLCGKEQSGKSEIMDALYHLCQNQNIPCTKVFDDQGTLHALDNDVYATGTEIGAYIHVNALPRSSIFQNLSSSVILKENDATTHFLTPFTTHEETCRFHKVDICIYLNQTSAPCGYHIIDNLETAFQLFEQEIRDHKQAPHPLTASVSEMSNDMLAQKIALLHSFMELMYLKDIEIALLHTHISKRSNERTYAHFAKLILEHIQML